jgi:hypothetical protein
MLCVDSFLTSVSAACPTAAVGHGVTIQLALIRGSHFVKTFEKKTQNWGNKDTAGRLGIRDEETED